jgi:DNA-directed RNA polymerase subunit M/transcription elongation factor TFIIS
MIFEEIEKVNFTKEPELITDSKNSSKYYSFQCKKCDNLMKVNYQTQIDNLWNNQSLSLSKNLIEELKRFYNIGISNKSQDGGFPIFGEITCKKCGTDYITYCGVREYSNSSYYVIVNGILITKPTK